MNTVGPDKRLNYYRLSPEAVMKELGSHKMGLTNVEAERRLRARGVNALTRPDDSVRLLQFIQACREPVVVLLLAGVIVTVFTGDLTVRVILLLLAITTVVATAALNRRRVISVTGLTNLMPPTARVVRNGEVHAIDTATLVTGDIVSLQEGDIVPADIRLVDENNFSTDDATLTGDHSLSHKSVPASRIATPLFLRHTMAYMGTRAATGTARGIVVATGMQTELGRIAALTQSAQQHRPPFQAQLGAISKRVAQAGIVLALASGLLGIAAGMSTPAALHLTLLVLVAATPLCLPLELILIRLENRDQLAGLRLRIQALSALDALASTDIVIVDPAATHAGNTTNATHVLVGRTTYTTEGHGYDPVGKILGIGEQEITGKELDDLALLFTAAALTSNAKVYQAHSRHHEWLALGNSVDAAILTLARRGGVHTESLHAEYQPLQRLAADPERTYTAGIFSRGDDTVLFVRGTVAAITERSKKLWDHNHVRNFTKGDLAYLLEHTENESLDARHTTALAYRLLPKNSTQNLGTVDELARNLTFLGVVSTHTPLQDALPEALGSLRSAGIAVSMIVDDEPAAARALARRAGIVAEHVSGVAVTSAEQQLLDDSQLLIYLEKGGVVFSRLAPEDILRLVEIAESAGHTTTLTGHGVSDMPALAHASVGITVAGDLGLHPVSAPHGSVIAGAILQGRLAYAHMQRALHVALTDNAAIVTLVVLGGAGQAIYNQPGSIQVLQVVLFSLLVQALVVVGLAWDAPTEHLMQQHPKRTALVSPTSAGEIAIFGLLAGAIAYANFLFYFTRIDISSAYIDPTSIFVTHAATVAFVTLVACQITNVFFLRVEHRKSDFARYVFDNQRLLVIAGLAVFIVLNILYITPLAQLFGFSGLDAGDWSAVLLAAAVYVVIRIVQQHTRKHSRHAVVKLHRSVYGKNSATRI